MADYVEQFAKLEAYLCHKLGGIDARQLDIRIMEWAEQAPDRWRTYEDLVRNGRRLEELRFYAQSLGTPEQTPTVSEVPAAPAATGGVFDL